MDINIWSRIKQNRGTALLTTEVYYYYFRTSGDIKVEILTKDGAAFPPHFVTIHNFTYRDLRYEIAFFALSPVSILKRACAAAAAVRRIYMP